MKIMFTQKIFSPSERKALLTPIAEQAGQSVQYAGAPSFAYTAAGWSVDKNNMVSSPTFDIGCELELQISQPELLREAGASTEGLLTVTLTPDGVDDEKAAIMQALLESKESLIRKALQTEAALTVGTGERGYTFAFFKATLDHAEIMAAIQFAVCIYEQSLSQKRVTSKDKDVDNEKYAFRCFLLRIGMIGKEYGTARKTLSKHLTGNSSFKSGERKKADDSVATPELPAADMNSLEEALADAELIHDVNALLDAEATGDGQEG